MSLFCMTMLYSCGGANSSTGLNSSSTSPIVQNGISSSAAGQFTGTWTGYLDLTYTAIEIAANGNITISCTGQATEQRLLVLQNGHYYIVNPQTKTGVQVRVSGSSLIVTFANAVEETFSKN
ncbi:MAG: hypothetical protein ACXVKO_15325 [Bacteriovorax sp.]